MGELARIDLRKELKTLYQPAATKVVAVEVPRLTFLMVDGSGDPNTSPAYQQAVETLFALSYTLKFMVKQGRAGGIRAVDYGVMPLEGLWWSSDMADFAPETTNRGNWSWTMMILQPTFITPDLVAEATTQAQSKGKLGSDTPARLESFVEGPCAQTMHIGPFSDEGPTIARVHDFIAASGRELAGKHHEIYLTDIRRADPAKWKTIIRQPMR